MKKLVIVCSLVLMLFFPIAGQEIMVEYLEGSLEVQSGSGWREVFIGDEIASDRILRLSDSGYSEISVNDAMITLVQDGNYVLKDLISSISQVSAATLDLKKKLTLNSDYEKWQQEAIMGVRGSQKAADGSGTEMEDAFVYLNAGLDLLAAEKYEEALESFHEGWETFEDDNSLFFAAVSYDALGQKGSYAKSLREVSGNSLERMFLPSFLLRKGDLLVRTLEYGEAAELLESFFQDTSYATAEEIQQAHYLLGVSYIGADNPAMARRELERAKSLTASPEIARQAGNALNKL